MISVNEADGGRYDCHLGGSLLCSYNITVDAHRYGRKIIIKQKVFYFLPTLSFLRIHYPSSIDKTMQKIIIIRSVTGF